MATSFEELEMSRDELKQLGSALKNENFRKLLVDYAEEVSNPENVAKFQEEMTLLEKERGVDITFINPEPGYVVKTSVDGRKKAFINVCKNENIGKPTAVGAVSSGAHGHTWSLPYSQAPPREDLDKSGKRCTVFDVVFHPYTFKLAENNSAFKTMLTDTALDAVEKSYNVKLDRKNLKFPKLKFKGMKRAAVIRKSSSDTPNSCDDEFLNRIFAEEPVSEETSHGQKKKESDNSDDSNLDTDYTKPKYKVTYRSDVDLKNCTVERTSKLNVTVPKELIVEIFLPLLNSSESTTLDVNEKRLILISENPAKYKLDIPLSYSVNENLGSAKFDKELRKLIVKLPVRQISPSVIDFCKDDSGVESDTGCRSSESNSGDDDNFSEVKNNHPVDISRSDSVISSSSSISNSSPDEGYSRTTTESSFLSSEIVYSLPSFTCNVLDNILCFTLHVKNVDPSSVEHVFLSNGKAGVYMKFVSVGSGFYPIYHAFCIEIPNCQLLKDELSIETWDNNVIMQMVIQDSHSTLSEYYAGLTEQTLMKYNLPEAMAFQKKFKQIQENNCNPDDNDDVEVNITKHTKEEVIIEVTNESQFLDGEAKNVSHSLEETEVRRKDSINNSKQMKNRTYSESSGDEMCLSPAKRGILKNAGRVCRSLSESSMDDYAWSSSLDVVTQSGSESCIPEETEDEENKCSKKTVRFNDVISKKTFRANSSILGQRKKNQRRARNKKRAHDRRASESETSECEVEKDQGGEEKTDEEEDNENGNELEETDVFIDESSGDNNPSCTESSVEVCSLDTGNNNVPCKSKTSKTQAEPIEFISDLLFDLDI